MPALFLLAANEALAAGNARSESVDAGLRQWKIFHDTLAGGGRGPELVAIPGGSYRVGSPESEPGRFANERAHTVAVDAFSIARHEVTLDEFLRFAKANGIVISPLPGPKAHRHPMVRVNWFHASRYAAWLSEQSGQTYRLPTEAEWEIAARARQASARHWGARAEAGCAYANVLDRHGQKFAGPRGEVHACNDGQAREAPVGRYRANGFGIYDMLGNVWEWTCSAFDEHYTGNEQRCVDAKAADSPRVIRGGSWQDGPRWVRSAVRLEVRPRDSDANIGFRIVRELVPGEALPNLRHADPDDELKKPDRSKPTHRVVYRARLDVREQVPAPNPSRVCVAKRAPAGPVTSRQPVSPTRPTLRCPTDSSIANARMPCLFADCGA